MSSASWPAVEVAGLTLGIREGVIGLIVLVALYMAFVLVRMRYLAHVAEVEAAGATTTEPRANNRVVDEADEEEPILYRREPTPAPNPSPRINHDALVVQAVNQELSQLHDEVAMLRSELSSLRADMQQELAVVRASQSVSPIYGDAMQLAISGYGAEMIAERCGIARAEAELVAALARSHEEAHR